MKSLLTLFSALTLCTAAPAQTMAALTTTAPSSFTAAEPLGCNVANTVCRYTDAATHATQVVVTLQSAFGVTVNGAGYGLTQVTSTLLVDSLYRKVADLECTLWGLRTMARSGSGRGGWAWHAHYDFSTLTIY